MWWCWLECLDLSRTAKVGQTQCWNELLCASLQEHRCLSSSVDEQSSLRMDQEEKKRCSILPRVLAQDCWLGDDECNLTWLIEVFSIHRCWKGVQCNMLLIKHERRGDNVGTSFSLTIIVVAGDGRIGAIDSGRVKERGIAMANLEATKANLLVQLVTLGNVMPLFEAVVAATKSWRVVVVGKGLLLVERQVVSHDNELLLANPGSDLLLEKVIQLLHITVTTGMSSVKIL